MPNGMLTPSEFEKEKDACFKINVLYRLVYKLYEERRFNRIKDSVKIMFGGFIGAIAFLMAHTWILH